MTPTAWPAMQSYLLLENQPWLELILVLGVGTAVIVGLAALAERLVRSAIWQRTIWQITILGVLTLMLVELTGTAPALVRLWRAQIRTATAQPTAALPAAEEQPPPAVVEPSASVGRRFLEEQEFPPAAGRFAETDWPVAAAPDFAWFDDPDVGRNEAADRTFFAATDEDPRRNEIEDLLQRATAPAEEPASVSRSTPKTGATATGATGGLPTSAKSNTVAKTLMDEPPAANAFWWLGVIWALGAMLIAARTVCARALLFALWRRRTRVSDGLPCERVGRLARRLGIRRRVCVLEAVGLSAPVAFGNFRPTVALPVTFTDDFDRRQQEAVLAHELAHLAARDPAWQVLANLLSAALWWHPLVWWSRHRLRAASEAAADEASLLVPGGPDLLAACLVAMGRRLAPPPQFGWLSFEGPGFRSSLGRRVERLLNLRTRSWRAPGRGRLALAKTALPVALVMVTVCCTAWARPQATLSEGGTTMNVLRASWRHSLAAAMLAFVTAGCSDAVADNPPIDESTPAVVGDDFSDADGQLALLAEDEEGELREGEKREREEGQAREREGREQREGEQRERREGEERERRELGEPERAELEGHLRELIRKRGELEEREHAISVQFAGSLRPEQREETRKLLPELREIRENARRLERERDHIIKRLGIGPERRIKHLNIAMENLNIAIENLHAGGLHDVAARLAHERKRLLGERPEPDRPRTFPARRPERRDPPPDPEFPPRLEQQERAIADLGGAVRELRGEVEELRRLLKDVLEGERDGQPPPPPRPPAPPLLKEVPERE